jgi:hypothetical protein
MKEWLERWWVIIVFLSWAPFWLVGGVIIAIQLELETLGVFSFL